MKRCRHKVSHVIERHVYCEIIYVCCIVLILFIENIYGFAALRSSSIEVSDKDAVLCMIMNKRDNEGMPFIIIDKKAARLYLYDKNGEIVDESPVLLGMGVGDVFPKEMHGKPISQIDEKLRITQAGRFMAQIGYDKKNKKLIWVDYETKLAIHEVVNVLSQNRMERLNSPSIQDNRITWGCINVPNEIFTKINNIFINGKGYVYIVPEIFPCCEVFKSDLD